MIVNTTYYSATGGRSNNEDAVALFEYPKSVLGIVADGLGGHRGGEIAAQTAITSIRDSLAGLPPSAAKLAEALDRANQDIRGNPYYPVMKTTAAVLWLGREQALCATIGDTRIYQFRGNSILFQSIDHSVAQAEVFAGTFPAEEIRHSRDRHKLTRALGTEGIRPDITVRNVAPGDAFLLCSDGFWVHVLEKEMLADLEAADTSAVWLKRMVRRLESAGGNAGDNHSALACLLRCS